MVIYADAQTRKHTTETGSNVSSTTFSSMIHFAPVVPVTTTAYNCDHQNRHTTHFTAHFTATWLSTYNDTRRRSTMLHDNRSLPPVLPRVCTHRRSTMPRDNTSLPPKLPRVNTHRRSSMLRDNTNWPPMLQRVGTAAKSLSSTP